MPKRRITVHYVNGKKQHTGTYNSWHTMRQRCENPNNSAYASYGGRGITVCDRWRTFKTFLADMGERPPGTTLDRTDNERGYSPDNCRWASRKVQANNSRLVRRYSAHGLTLTLTEWAERLGQQRENLRLRLKRKWPLEAVFGPPVRRSVSHHP